MNNSSQQQDFTSGVNEQWMTEQWLMMAGVVSESSVDTLLMYAYAQVGVTNVKLEIDNDPSSKGENPIVTYKVTLSPIANELRKAYKKSEAIKFGIVRKLALLAIAKAGAPLGVEEEIQRLATDYLPKKYSVKVEIND